MFGSLLFPARSLPAFQLSVALEISKAANAAETETAFAVKEGEKYHFRWFTPGGEIDLWQGDMTVWIKVGCSF